MNLKGKRDNKASQEPLPSAVYSFSLLLLQLRPNIKERKKAVVKPIIQMSFMTYCTH